MRAQGTPVTPQTFAEWKQKRDAEVLLKKMRLQPEAVNRDKGPSGKIFFMNQEAASSVQVIILAKSKFASIMQVMSSYRQ